MPRSKKNVEKVKSKTLQKIIVVALLLISVLFILKYAKNYLRDDVVGKTNLVINRSNVTTSLKQDVFIKDDVIYLSKQDIQNFFDPYIYYDKKYNQIITGSDTKIASIVVGEKQMNNNDSVVAIQAEIIEKDGTYYLPFSALDKIYNTKTTYIKETDTAIIESLNRKCVVADSKKNNSVKYTRTSISRTVDRVERGENLVLLEDEGEKGWLKVRTDRGKIGYVKENSIANKTTIREDYEISKRIDGNVSLIWDYFTQYRSAPSSTDKIKGVNVVAPTFFTLKRLGKGAINENFGSNGTAYVKWAHENGYEVWPTVSNGSMTDTTSEIMNDYKLRQKVINKIVSYIVKYDLDGINIDFENMYAADKDLFSRFLIELAPRLNEIGAVLSVDVTAPDGSENWSMCYNRNLIGKVADYVVFMGYDQNTTKIGPNAGYDWLKVSLNKFVGTQEEVPAEKIVLGIPFYARIWYTNSSGKADNDAININKIDSVIPSSAERKWDDNVKQYIAEYTKNGTKYKAWIEDKKSIDEKLNLVKEYNLAGAAYWQKGGETSEILDLISEKLGI